MKIIYWLTILTMFWFIQQAWGISVDRPGNYYLVSYQANTEKQPSKDCVKKLFDNKEHNGVRYCDIDNNRAVRPMNPDEYYITLCYTKKPEPVLEEVNICGLTFKRTNSKGYWFKVRF